MGQHSSEKKHRSSREDGDSNRKRSKHSSSSKSSSSKSSKPSKEAEEDEWVEAPNTFTPSNLGSNLFGLEDSTDGYGVGEVGDTTGPVTTSSAGDFFSDFGTERKRKEIKKGVDPTETMGQSSRELNKSHWQPNSTASTSDIGPGIPILPSNPTKLVPGSSGSSWRMSKLKRTYELAEEESRPLEEVILERYGKMEDGGWAEALEERKVLDSRSGNSSKRDNQRGGKRDEGGRKYLYNDSVSGTPTNSRPSSRNEFRRPGESTPANSTPLQFMNTPSGQGVRTPIPSVFTPTISRNNTVIGGGEKLGSSKLSTQEVITVLTQSELNKLQAKVLKARLMESDDADSLEAEFEVERKKFVENGMIGSGSDGVQVMPTLDGRGKLYDVGLGVEDPESGKGKIGANGRIRKPKEKAGEVFDVKTGELIEGDADFKTSLQELVRQEKFTGGADDKSNIDSEMAGRIMGDTKFINSLDYVEENSELLARKKMKSEVLKKAFAINDYAKTKKALDSCTLCHPESGGPPKAAIVALGHYTYLSLMESEELVPGHCRIIPVQHHFSTLEAEDDCWDEIKNFMKTLMKMFAEEDKGVIFFESVLNLKHQKHTFIECIPIPFSLFDEIPIYFSEAISTSETEWSQHKALIPYSIQRPFRKSLVPNLPYFSVQFDYKGEKGFGHIIEGIDDAPEVDADGDEIRGELGEKGSGEFTKYFAQEIIGNLLELEPRQWRKPKRIDFRKNTERVEKFKLKYDQFDWTKMLS